MPLGLGIWEIVIIAVVIILLFGAKGVPQMARRLGTGVREVKDAVSDVDPRKMLDSPAAETRNDAQARPQTTARQQRPPDEP